MELVIYNIKGQKIKTFPVTLSGDEGSGNTYSVIWNGLNNSGDTVGSGIYFYALSLDGKIVGQQKMVLIE